VTSFFPPHQVYTEAFGGSASVLMRKPRVYAEIYNDLDGEIVNVFRILQDPVLAGRLRARVALTPFARAEFTRAYDPTGDPEEQARRTIIKSFMGFGSSAIHGHSRSMRTASRPTTGFRANSNRSGTIPAHDWSNWPESIPAFVERLRGVVIEQTNALNLLATHDKPDALHYVDPPYPLSTRSPARRRKSEYAFELDEAGHRALRAALGRLKGYVIVSGYRCALYDTLYAGWARHDRAALADGARQRIESVWLSPRTTKAQGKATRLAVGIDLRAGFLRLAVRRLKNP